LIRPDPIIDLSTAYWKSRAFLAAVKLGVFRHCGSEGQPLAVLAQSIQVSPQKLKPLIGVLKELDLIRTDEFTGDICLTKLAHVYLNPDSPACMETSLDYAREMYLQWDKLEERLQAPQQFNPTPTKEATPSFLLGMHNRAKMIAGAVLPLLKLEPNSRLLDVAAGAGTWSWLLQKQYDFSSLTLLEQPALMPAMKAFIESEGLVSANFIAADYHDDFSEDLFDAVLYFGALHQETSENITSCLEHLWDRVAPAGKMWILDIFVVDGESALFANLFGLNMLISSEGSVFELKEVETMLKTLPKLVQLKTHPVPGSLPYYLIEISKEV